MYFETIRINDVEKYIGKNGVLLVDLRNKEEYAQGHICGAVNIPYNCLTEAKEYLKKYEKILLYCDRGNVSMLATRDLYREGYPVINLYGGILSYRGCLVKELR